MARHYKSHRGGSSVDHHSDKFNDEHKHQKDGHERNMYRRPVSAGEHYAGMPTRMRTELEDSAMIHEDHRAIANLPQEVMIKPYPMAGSYIREVLNDDISGVDAQMGYDDAKRREHFYPKKV